MEPQTPRVARAEDGIPWLHRESPQGRDFLSLLQQHMLGLRAGMGGVSVTSSINSLHRGRLCEPELLSLQATESSLRRLRCTGEAQGDASGGDASGGDACTRGRSAGAARPRGGGQLTVRAPLPSFCPRLSSPPPQTSAFRVPPRLSRLLREKLNVLP